jgi:hypothetical protein
MADPNFDDDSEFPGELDHDFDDDSLLGDDDEDDDVDGDGVADLSGVVNCPYCGESVEITLDPGSGANQQYIEDCHVCCRPWLVSVSYEEDGTAHVFVDASDDHDSDD